MSSDVPGDNIYVGSKNVELSFKKLEDLAKASEVECALVSGHNLIFFFKRRNQLCPGSIILQSIESRL